MQAGQSEGAREVPGCGGFDVAIRMPASRHRGSRRLVRGGGTSLGGCGGAAACDWRVQSIGFPPVRCAARRKARRLGAGEYARSNPVEVQVVLAKRPEKGRHRLTVFGRKSTAKTSLHASRAAKEPWLLVHSPGLSHLQSRAIVKLYAQRMRIEQSFRDTKNLRYGQGLEASRSRGQLRLEMLLLILHLAAIVQRLIGEAAKNQQLELQFAATRRRSRPEISVMTLARRIIRDGQACLRRVLPCLTFSPLTQQARLACAARS